MFVKMVKEKKYFDPRINREITISRVFKEEVKDGQTYNDVWHKVYNQAKTWQKAAVEIPQIIEQKFEMNSNEPLNVEEIFKNFA